ncbi:uncharacterized protein BO80DRAFT_85784 [Aspergillus ibericus CBS 121593]|uniref:Uncharacterized protein n=1 Tax=Aspergillus ibericus CBS 121593 TaxID=1448316 RepID=A0A395HIA1_9EURO|nr:hypothetical protein BO80DRAFT_85784 [Aspergillus ibericus CBS 121593]RAL05984.1 hypothetical protein BO80DRAFT_85784 [Aspergillus ibericus CBS 121593]
MGGRIPRRSPLFAYTCSSRSSPFFAPFLPPRLGTHFHPPRRLATNLIQNGSKHRAIHLSQTPSAAHPQLLRIPFPDPAGASLAAWQLSRACSLHPYPQSSPFRLLQPNRCAVPSPPPRLPCLPTIESILPHEASLQLSESVGQNASGPHT